VNVTASGAKNSMNAARHPLTVAACANARSVSAISCRAAADSACAAVAAADVTMKARERKVRFMLRSG